MSGRVKTLVGVTLNILPSKNYSPETRISNPHMAIFTQSCLNHWTICVELTTKLYGQYWKTLRINWYEKME
jgi:hypothetical protein